MLYQYTSNLHVVPLGDLREHTSDKDCWCKPTPDAENESVMIHHSLDGREKYESGELTPH